jgi:hypothetical protein
MGEAGRKYQRQLEDSELGQTISEFVSEQKRSGEHVVRTRLFGDAPRHVGIGVGALALQLGTEIERSQDQAVVGRNAARNGCHFSQMCLDAAKRKRTAIRAVHNKAKKA